MTNAYASKFDRYVCLGDTIEAQVDGYTFTATIEHDHDAHIDDDDIHNIDQTVTGCDDEQQERLLAARKAWQNNEWFFCRIVIGVSRNGIPLDDCAASLWGIEANHPESDNAYLTEVANDLIDDARHGAETARARVLSALTV